MTDTFVLSVGHAHELQHAFIRNNWTVEMVHELCKGDTLTKVREHLFPLLDKPFGEIITREACERAGGRRSYVTIMNCLTNDGIATVRDVISRSEAEILRTPNLGAKSVEVLKLILAERGLTFAHN